MFGGSPELENPSENGRGGRGDEDGHRDTAATDRSDAGYAENLGEGRGHNRARGAEGDTHKNEKGDGHQGGGMQKETDGQGKHQAGQPNQSQGAEPIHPGSRR